MDRFTIKSSNDENVEFFVNGRWVGSANHDEHGWAGMKAAEDLFHYIAATLDYAVEDHR